MELLREYFRKSIYFINVYIYKYLQIYSTGNIFTSYNTIVLSQPQSEPDAEGSL